jgi:hypothetical protein
MILLLIVPWKYMMIVVVTKNSERKIEINSIASEMEF